MFNINVDADQEVALPVGESFPRTGFIGQWKASPGWEVGWASVNLHQAQEDKAADLGGAIDDYLPKLACTNGLPYNDVMVSRAGDMFNYFYLDQGVAQVACEMLDREEPRDWAWRPQQVWRFSAPVATLQVADSAREKFSDPLSFSVSMMTLRSKKRRHEFHMLALPAFVAAYAAVRGLETPGFDLSALLVPEDKLIINDETQLAYIGNGDVGYNDALLWKQRAALWAALGEEDPERNHTITAGTALSTTSMQLNDLLVPTVTPWTGGGIWARIIPVPDPRVDAAYGEGDDRRRPGIACLTEIFADEASAKVAAEKDRPQAEESKSESAAAPAAPSVPAGPSAPAPISAAPPDGLTVPAVWSLHRDNWITQVQQIKEMLAEIPPPLHADAIAAMTTVGSDEYLGFDLGATQEEVVAWLPYV